MRAVTIFRKSVKGDNNIFSPNIVEYGHSAKNHDYVYEISWGKGILGGYLAGATIVNIFNGHMPSLGQCFTSDNKSDAISQALAYANSLE